MNIIRPNITINSNKFDSRIDKTWKADLLSLDENLLIFRGVFEQEIKHDTLGVIGRGWISYEYFWLTKWFNVFRFENAEGYFKHFYCNICMPPKFENDVLDYIDLDIDLLVWKDFSYQILDLDEYETNRIKFGYSAELVSEVEKSLTCLIEDIEKRRFPFNLNFEK